MTDLDAARAARIAEIRALIGDPPSMEVDKHSQELIDQLRETISVIDEKLATKTPKRYREQLERHKSRVEVALAGFMPQDEYALPRELLAMVDAQDAEIARLRAALVAVMAVELAPGGVYDRSLIQAFNRQIATMRSIAANAVSGKQEVDDGR